MTNNFPVLFTEGKHHLLVLDPSSSHLAYCLCELDFSTKELFIANCGMLWTADKWSKAQRYIYMQKCLNLLVQGDSYIVPSYAISESFFVNPRMLAHSAVIPTVNAFLLMAAHTYNLRYEEIGPTAWRGLLGIKAIKDAKGKKDFKVPTADLVKKHIDLPNTIISNINNKERNLPHDVTDVLAIAIAIAKHHGIVKVTQGNVCFHPLSWIEKFSNLAKGI